MKKKEHLTTYMDLIIQQLEAEGRLGTAHVYRSTLHRILDFTGGQPLTFGEVTPLWLKAFQNYLLGRQLQWNSVSTYMRMLRAVYLRAVDAEMAVFRPRLFKGVYTGTRVTVKRALSENDLRKLNEPKPAVRECSIEKIRLLFLLLFMLRGIPFCRRCFRHSWATIANYHNYQQELICNAMGHSSVKVTETYFKQHTDERIGQMNKEILSQVFRE